MELVVPWARLVARLRPFYPKGERGRPPIGLERMLRIYFLQQWYGLADEALEDALYDSQALRGFTDIDLTRDPVPDATTLLKFRHWLERHDLTRVLFEEVGAVLEERGLLMRQGTIVDATIIAAPPSTKKQEQEPRPGDAPDQEGQPVALRDEGAYRGGRCLRSGAHGHGHRRQRSRYHQMAAVLHGSEEAVFADAGYSGADKRPELADRDVSWNIAIKRSIIKTFAQRVTGLGRGGGESAVAGPGLGRASLPRGQEPVPV